MERGEKTRKISAGTIPLRTMTGDGAGRIVSQTGWLEQTIQPREEAEGVNHPLSWQKTVEIWSQHPTGKRKIPRGYKFLHKILF
jgi:hypothetical protein